MIAVLYVDPLGPYPKMDGVDWWDEARDATTYAGPHAVIAHPDCGPWGKLRHLYRGHGHDCAPRAVEQVRRWGGVLERPAHSRLWAYAELPKPGAGRDAWGGYAIAINQSDWGHCARKPTWIYCVGVDPALAAQRPASREPTHWIGGTRNVVRGGHRGRVPPGIKVCSAQQRRRTPPLFAAWLVSLAASVRPRPRFV